MSDSNLTDYGWEHAGSRVSLFYARIPVPEMEVRVFMLRGGALYDRPGKRGEHHILEHCLASTMGDLSVGETADYLYNNGIFMNAYTDRRWMEFVFRCHRIDVKRMIECVQQFIYKNKISKEVFLNEKRVVIKEMLDVRSRKMYHINEKVNRMLYTPGSIQNIEVLGDEESVRNIDFDDLTKLYPQAFLSSKYVVTVSGYGEFVDYSKKLIDHISVVPYEIQDESPFESNVTIPPGFYDIHDYAGNIIRLIVVIPVNLAHIVEWMFLEELMFNGTNGIVFEGLRTKLNVVYSVYKNYDWFSKTLRIEMDIDKRNLQKTLGFLDSVFDDTFGRLTEENSRIVGEILLKRIEIDMVRMHRHAGFAIEAYRHVGKFMTLQTLFDDCMKFSYENLCDIVERCRKAIAEKRVFVY